MPERLKIELYNQRSIKAVPIHELYEIEFIPNIGDIVYFKDRRYVIKMRVFDLDKGIIKLYCDE